MTSPAANSISHPSFFERIRQWIIANPFLFLGIIYLLVNGVLLVFSRQISSEWDQVFVRAARELVGGGDIYSVPVVTSTRPTAELFQLLQSVHVSAVSGDYRNSVSLFASFAEPVWVVFGAGGGADDDLARWVEGGWGTGAEPGRVDAGGGGDLPARADCGNAVCSGGFRASAIRHSD